MNIKEFSLRQLLRRSILTHNWLMKFIDIEKVYILGLWNICSNSLSLKMFENTDKE